MVKAYQMAKVDDRNNYENSEARQEVDERENVPFRAEMLRLSRGVGVLHKELDAHNSVSRHHTDSSFLRSDDGRAIRSRENCDSRGDRDSEEKRRGGDSKHDQYNGMHAHLDEELSGDHRSNEYYYYNNSERNESNYSQCKDNPLGDDSEMLKWRCGSCMLTVTVFSSAVYG